MSRNPPKESFGQKQDKFIHCLWASIQYHTPGKKVKKQYRVRGIFELFSLTSVAERVKEREYNGIHCT